MITSNPPSGLKHFLLGSSNGEQTVCYPATDDSYASHMASLIAWGLFAEPVGESNEKDIVRTPGKMADVMAR